MPRSTTLCRLAAPLLAVATLGAACSNSSSSGSSGSGSAASGPSGGATTTVAGASGPAGTLPKVSGTLLGSGSTFQQAFDDAAIGAFTALEPGSTINYQPKGSGAGQTDLSNQVVDFAGSDVPEKDAQLPMNKGGAILYFPLVLGPITVSFNLPGVTDLQLSGPTVAKIFAGKITTWNDPAVAADNPGVTLPATAITVVHRSDSSGTTANFTEYLTKADPTDWTLGTGKTVNWASNTQAGNGNTGVATDIKATSGAVGYVDFSNATATKLTFAKIKNPAGNFVAATLAGASAAAADVTPAANLTFDPIYASGAQDYPITSPTYLITYAKYADPAKTALLQAFLTYVLGADGQGLAAANGYAALPAGVDHAALAQVATITG